MEGLPSVLFLIANGKTQVVTAFATEWSKDVKSSQYMAPRACYLHIPNLKSRGALCLNVSWFRTKLLGNLPSRKVLWLSIIGLN